MTKEQELMVNAFATLGKIMVSLGKGEDWKGYDSGVNEKEYNDLVAIINRQHIYNGWFTKDSVQHSLLALGSKLNQKDLSEWLSNYSYTNTPKKVAVIMAGNLPLVGFHDFLCVLLSGNKVIAKLSSDDNKLLPALASILMELNHDFRDKIEFALAKLEGMEAVIATGSNNSAMYFEKYFGKYPHIIRKNRTSIAVLDGSESKEQLENLGKDIFTHFGLGCRNVTQILMPKDFDLDRIFGAIVGFSDVVNHNKYGNNYDYNKAIFLMNQDSLLENGFILFKESKDIHSPLAVMYYHRYENESEVQDFLKENEDVIQCVVGNEFLPFGEAQNPQLSDYADGVDTMKFLEEL